jgi:esterase/lipase superfamily enzyme
MEKLGPDARKITVISSTNDRALQMSSQIAGGAVRAVRAERGRLEALGVRVADASEFAGGLINHDLFLSNATSSRWSAAPSSAWGARAPHAQTGARWPVQPAPV